MKKVFAYWVWDAGSSVQKERTMPQDYLSPPQEVFKTKEAAEKALVKYLKGRSKDCSFYTEVPGYTKVFSIDLK